MLRWLLLPIYAVLHACAIALTGQSADTVSLAFQFVAPLVAMLASLRNCVGTSFKPSDGWSMIAAAFAIWTLGISLPILQTRFDHTESQLLAYADVLVFVLYATPLVWLISTPFRQRDVPTAQLIDGFTALALGILFFMLTLEIASNGQSALSTRQLSLLFDVENFFLLAGAIFRYWAASSAAERRLYAALLTYAVLYAAIAAFNNNVITVMLHLKSGNYFEVLIPLPFLAFTISSRAGPARPRTERRIRALRARYARISSPLILYLASVGTGLTLTRTSFSLGVAATLAALGAYGLRSIIRELRLIEERTRLRSSRADLQKQALVDPLTGVANRRALEAALDREFKAAFRSGHTLGVLLIDIDHFKLLNDTSGHQAGDTCLRTVAQTLEAQIRRPEDLLARYGGEEFVVLLPTTDRCGAVNVAEALRQSIQALQWPNHGAPTGYLGVSIGVACELIRLEDNAQNLIEKADRALYLAKAEGRNRVCAEWLKFPPESKLAH